MHSPTEACACERNTQGWTVDRQPHESVKGALFPHCRTWATRRIIVEVSPKATACYLESRVRWGGELPSPALWKPSGTFTPSRRVHGVLLSLCNTFQQCDVIIVAPTVDLKRRHVHANTTPKTRTVDRPPQEWIKVALFPHCRAWVTSNITVGVSPIAKSNYLGPRVHE